jgi:hypothetical protein
LEYIYFINIGQPKVSERKDQSNLKVSVNGAVHAGLSAIALAYALGVTPARINDIVREWSGIEKPHSQNIGFLIGPPQRHRDCTN